MMPTSLSSGVPNEPGRPKVPGVVRYSEEEVSHRD